MPRRSKEKRSKVLVHCLAIVTLMLLGLVGSTDIALAQELSEEQEETQMAAMVQYTLRYRFGQDLQVGDWVKYTEITQQGENTIELKVTKQEKGGVWIVEEFPGMKIHLLVDLKSMKVLEGFGFDEEGEKRVMSPLDDKELAGIIEMGQKQMEQQGAYSQFISWKKGEETEVVDIPAGSFTCVYLRPEYSEEHAKRMQDYTELMREQGKSDAEIDAEISKREPRLYFNNDVPKLLPMQIAMGWMPYINIFEEVKGGLVECKHMSLLRLAAYSGQKE